jgi:hypothetical protein
MIVQQSMRVGGLWVALLAGAASPALAQAGAETFTATATVDTAGKSSAKAPVTMVVSRMMSQAEADKFVAAFKSGGVAGLRKALTGVAPTGSIKVADGAQTPTRLAIERPTDKGRLLTLVCDQPILHLGAGLPGAKPKEGYDLAVVHLEVDASGNGSGTLAPAAKVSINKDGAFVVDDYGSELVRLTAVKKAAAPAKK